MLDELDEDNELALLEPVVERARSTSTSFTYNTFGSRFGGAAYGMVHWKDENEPPAKRRLVDGSITQRCRKEGWFQRGKLCVSLHSFINSMLMLFALIRLKML